jgi:hypothetical protein
MHSENNQVLVEWRDERRRVELDTSVSISSFLEFLSQMDPQNHLVPSEWRDESERVLLRTSYSLMSYVEFFDQNSESDQILDRIVTMIARELQAERSLRDLNSESPGRHDGDSDCDSLRQREKERQRGDDPRAAKPTSIVSSKIRCSVSCRDENDLPCFPQGGAVKGEDPVGNNVVPQCEVCERASQFERWRDVLDRGICGF